MRELKDKVAVVTGAASGIGRGLAQRFAEEGMRVVLADVESAPLVSAVEELQRAGHTAIGVRTDVSSADSVAALAQRTLDEFGAVHVVCNNAGVAGTALPAWELPLAAWRWMIDVNVLGVVHGIKSFVPLLVAQGEGHVVNTTSLAGLAGGVGSAPYTATKHAVVGLSESLKAELEATGSPVKVSLLVPGRVDTRIGEALRNWPAELGPVPEARREDRISNMPIPEVLAPMLRAPLPVDHVAGLVVEAIRGEYFWVITHPHEIRQLMGDRMRALTEDSKES